MSKAGDRTDLAELEEISAVIADVYDAALDPDIWHLALESACEFVEGAAGFLYFQDLAGMSGDACYVFGDDPGQRQSCFEAFSKFNPAYVAAPELAIGDVRSGLSLFSEVDLRASPLHSGWLEPQSYCDFATVVLERSNVTLTCLTFAKQEGDGCVEPPMVERIGLLVPHFRRASAIAEALGMRKVQADALSEVVDGLSAGVFLVDAQGGVVHANASGRRMLEEARVLDVRRDVLRASDRKLDGVLKAALAGAADAVPSGPGAPIRLGGDDDAHLAHILPLTTGHRRETGRRFSAVAAVVVHRAALDPGASLQVLQQLYGLTPGETRVLGAAADALGSREMAERLHISENTINTHLRRLFEKTGVHRRDELIKLVATHSGPLAS